MASRADIEAGKAFIELYVKNSKLLVGLSQSRASVFRFAADVAHILSPATWLKGIGSVFSSLGRKTMTAGTMMGMAFVPAIRAASNATETLNKYQAVFGNMADSVGVWIDTLGKRVGRSGLGIRDTISAYQAFFKGLGFGEQQAAGMSREMAALAIDLGSFFNKSDEESNQRFLSALSGSSEVLDQFGINTKQAALEAELAALGINKAWVDVTEPEKVLARINIIRKAMAAQGAIGDAERTRGSLANLWRDLTGKLSELAATVGSAFVPVITPLVKRVAELVTEFGEWARKNQNIIANIGRLTIQLTAFGAGLYAMGKAFSIAGVVLGATMKLSMFGTIAMFVLPFLVKFVPVLTMMSVAFSGLKLALSLTVPFLAKFALLSGGVTLGIAAIGLAWANAQAQGISFGESVLDLTHRITGLSNAYTRLRDAEEFSKENSRIGGRAEGAAREGDVPEFDRSIKALKARREEAAQKVREAQERASSEGAMSYDPRAWLGIPSTAKEDLKAAQLELARLDGQIERLGKQRPFVVATAWLSAIPGAAKGAGKQFGTSFLEGFKSVVKTHLRVIDEFLPDLRRAQAEAIVDPREREIALKRLEWEERIKKARAERLPEDTLKRTRDQEIKNINDRYDREEADRFIRMNQQTAEDTARLRIETTKKGLDKELALLHLRQQKEMDEAKRIGANRGMLAEKHALEEKQLRMQSTKLPQISPRGTFSAWEALTFGNTGTTADRQIQEQRRANASLKRMERLAERQIDAIRRLTGVKFT